MPKEYKVKINVDTSAAEGAIAKFDQKVQRTFDKLNKTSFKPEAFINGINISITKVMELAAKQEQAAAKTAQANAKMAQENAKLAQSEAKLAAEKEKTAQANAKSASAQAKANADMEKAAAKVAASQNKLAGDMVKAETQKQTAMLRSADVAQKAEAQMRTAAEKTVQTQINSNTKLATTRMQTQSQVAKADQQQQQSAQQTGNVVESENAKMGASYEKLASTATNAFNQIKMVIGFAGMASVFRSAFNEMKAMSDELVTYQKVTGATAEQMKQVRSSAYQSAKQYGQSPSDYLSSVATMARAGYGQQAEAMANLATKTQLVGDMSAEMASKFLIAVDAGYQMKCNIEELEKVLNAANVADNNYATSLAQIAEGMTLIAPLAAGMNVSVNEAMAAIGTMQALTQRSGTEVARAFRMIAINIAKDTETEVEEGFKLTQENIEDFNALLQEFAKEELAAAEASGKLLSPMKAIEAIAKAWKSGKLSEQQLFSVLNNIGGARYTNSIMALVKNFDVYQEMLGKFATELTSANDEVNAMMDSWSRKLEVLKTSWVEMVNTLISEDYIKNLLDMGTGFLQFSGGLENFIMIVGGATKAFSALRSGMKNVLSGQSFGAINGWVAGISAVTAAIGLASAAVENYRRKQLESSNEAAKSVKEAYDQSKSLDELIARYNELSEDGTIDDTELEEVKQIQADINALVGDLPGKYDLVTGSIEEAKKKLAEMNAEQRKNAMVSAQEAVNTTGNALVNYGSIPLFGTFTGLNTPINATRTSWGAINEFLSGALGKDSMFRLGFTGTDQDVLEYAGKKNADDILKAYDELSKIIDKATEAGLDKVAKDFYFALIETRDNMKESAENYRSAVKYNELIKTGDFSGEGGSSSGGTGTDTGTNAAKEGTQAVDAYAESYNRLQAAITAATTAQETFNKETGAKKSDQLKFYGSALEAYNEELKAGRVNSNAFHAAAKALMGEEAYNATGGYTQNVQAAMNAKGSGGISLIDAITTLTDEYKNQKGQVVEGAGLAVLLEKLGYNVKDEKGNYAVRMTEEIYKEVMAAIPGMTREMLENAANAYDQYDTKGHNANLAPEVKEKTAEETAAETQKTAADTQLEAANTMQAATGSLKEMIKAGKDADSGEGEQGEKEGSGYTPPETVPNPVSSNGETHIAVGDERVIARSVSPGVMPDGTTGSASDGIGAYYSPQYIADHKKPTGSTESHINKDTSGWPQLGDAIFKDADPGKGEQGEEEGSGYTPPETVPNPVSSNGETHFAVGDERVIARSVSPGVMPDGTAGSKGIVRPQGGMTSSISDVTDAETAADQQQKVVKDIYKELDGFFAEKLENIDKNTNTVYMQRTQAMQLALQRGDATSAFGGDAKKAAQYQEAMRQGDFTGAKQMVEAYLNADGLDLNPQISGELNASLDEIVVGVKPILEKYSADEVVQALQSLTDEKREAVIKAMLETFSLEEVMKALESATEEDRVAIISAAIDKHGEEAVAKFIADLPPEKQDTYLQALIKADAQGTINKYLDMLPEAERITRLAAMAKEGNQKVVNAYIDSLPEKQRNTTLASLVKSGNASVVNQYIDSLPEEKRITTLASLVKSGNASVVNQYIDSLPEEKRITTLASLVKSGNKGVVTEYINSLPKEERITTLKSLVASGNSAVVSAYVSTLPPDEQITTIQTLIDEGDYETAAAAIAGLSAEQQAMILAFLDQDSAAAVEAALLLLTADETKTIYVEEVESPGGNARNKVNNVNQKTGSTNYVYPVGTKSHPGGAALVNDGTGAELILDSAGAHIANGGREAIVNLENGARVYTAEQTRRMLGSIPHYAVGSLNAQPNYTDGGGTGGSSRVQQLVKELNDYFDSIQTGDTSYTKSDGKNGNGSGSKTSGSGGGGGGGGSGGKSASDENWDSLKSLIEYILKRLGKALDEQERIIDKQIEALEAQRSRSEEQNRLEELQKAVTTAQSDLIEAESERTVRYLDDNGQWHWMADQKKVQQAKEALEKSQKELQDYLNDLVIDAQIEALNKEKDRLNEEYTGYTDLWSDILDAVATPTGGLVELLNALTKDGTGAQKNGAAAVKGLLIKALQGGSYKKNYTEALGEIGKAAADNPSVPGISDAALAALIASSGTNVSRSAMMDALQNIAGGGTLAGGAASQNTTNHQDTYYMINGVQIGSDMADLPMSEVLRRLSVFNNTLQ